MHQKIRVGINGFGRIGRNLFRLLLNHPLIEVVAVNDISDKGTMCHLLKYDSIHGVLPYECNHDDLGILVNHTHFPFFHQPSPSSIDWRSVNAEIVVECSGRFKSRFALEGHLQSGARKVILSAPPESDDIKTVVIGVNDNVLTAEDVVVSNASCTTNNAAPMIDVIRNLCGIEQAYITTVHSYTTDQSLHDQPHHDLRRARAAAQSIVPTTTGAAKALTRIFPEFEGKIGGSGIRVPVPDGSLTDITCYVSKEVSIHQINEAFHVASEGSLKGILSYTADPIVSVDVIGNPHSCVFDSLLTSAIGKMVKIVGWYDNEIGYANRLADLIVLMKNQK